MTVAAGMTVHGTCGKCGHQMTATAGRGAGKRQLATHRAPCPQCGTLIVCRRPKPDATPTAPASSPAPAPTKRGRRPLVRGTYDATTTPPRRDPDVQQPAPAGPGDSSLGAGGTAATTVTERAPSADHDANAPDPDDTEPRDRGKPARPGKEGTATRPGIPETGHRRHPYPELGWDW